MLIQLFSQCYAGVCVDKSKVPAIDAETPGSPNTVPRPSPTTTTSTTTTSTTVTSSGTDSSITIWEFDLDNLSVSDALFMLEAYINCSGDCSCFVLYCRKEGKDYLCRNSAKQCYQ